jgi:hypothetical protein
LLYLLSTYVLRGTKVNTEAAMNESDTFIAIVPNTDCPCGAVSTVGTHVIDGEHVSSSYFCDDHWNRKVDVKDIEVDAE